MVYDTIMIYFLYARKSTDVEDKQVLSIAAQLSELRTLAKNEGLGIATEFTESRTAKLPGRPVFNDMMARIQRGEAQGVICWKLDRLARNPVDDGLVRWSLQQGTIQRIATPEKSYYPPDNVLLMSVEFGMANQFIRDLSSNTKRGLHHKARLGIFPSLAPTGYLNDVRAKTIVVDRKKSKHIRAAFELYAKGNSRLEDISKFLFDNGVRSSGGLALHKDRIRFILTNPFYYGQFRYGDEIYEGKHTPLITKELFDKVQRVVEKRGHPQKLDKQPKAFCGLLRCGECGSMITAEIQKGHVYYRCTKKSKTARCLQPYVREETLTADLSELLTQYAMPQEWAQGLLALVAKDEKDATRTAAVVVSGLQEKKADISRKLDRLTDLFVEQDIDRDAYLERKRSLMSARKSVEEVQAKAQSGQCAWLEPMREWIIEASILDETAKNFDLPSKKSSLQKIFGSNLTLRNKKPVENPLKHYASLREARLNFSENDLSFILAAGLGFEPRYTAPEAVVLPLDDPAN